MNILLVAETKSFIIASLVQQLEEMEYSIIQAGNDLCKGRKMQEKVQALLLFVDEEIAADMNLLVYLKDMIIEEDLPVLIMGEKEGIEEVEKVLPQQFIKKRFFRPFNVKNTAEDIDEFLQYDMTHIKKKILVVDDSGVMLRNVKGWLEDKYQVILANSGTLAIKYLAMNQPDLILLDYEMPVCDGKQVLEMIRSEPEFSGVPVIFLTARNDREAVLNVSALKPEGYLLKTMEPAQIVHAIDEFFEKRKGKI